MPEPIQIGTAVARPGSIQYGQWDALSHPTGHVEFMPVIIAQGREEGPCLWLTAGIHGPEHSGPAVLYHLLTEDLAQRMRGTIVAFPALCPAGLRTMTYVPYHAPYNPNRMWPDGRPASPPDDDRDPPSSLEIAFGRLFELMQQSADMLIDYHNAWTGSISFAFRDRVLYRADTHADENRAAAEALSAAQEQMLEAYGHTVVIEFPPEKYITEDLHRATSSSALLVAGIPGFTVELGTGHMPDPAITRASVAGTRNVMRRAGMLDGPMEPIEGIVKIDPGFPVRRATTPRAREACVILHLAEPGDLIHPGDPIAEVRDVWGRPLGEGVLRAEHDGFVIGRSHGIYFYPGTAIYTLAVRDTAPLVVPYPETFFRPEGRRNDDFLKQR